MANSHRMGRKLDPKWHCPNEVKEITEKGLYQSKCMKSGKVLKQVFSFFAAKGLQQSPSPRLVMKYF